MTTFIAKVAINYMRSLANREEICQTTKPVYDVLQGVTMRHVNSNRGPVQVFDTSTLGRLTPTALTAKTFVRRVLSAIKTHICVWVPFVANRSGLGL
jgi:hypothetical protein